MNVVEASLFLFHVYCVFIINTLAQSNDNTETCITADNVQGTCIVFSHCSSLYNLIDIKPLPDEIVRYLRKSHCGYYKSEPKVCCSITDTINATNLPEVTEKVPSNILLPGPGVCGISPIDRIIYGSQAQLDSYPWLVLLEYQKPQGRGLHCGGVLINQKYILTAAHCVLDIPNDWKLIGVRLGEYDLQTDPDCVEEFVGVRDCAEPTVNVQIETKITHNNYQRSNSNKHDNIALLRLKTPVKYSDYIRPICLPSSHETKKGSQFLDVAGWGINSRMQSHLVKQQSTVSALSNSNCSALFNNKIQLNDNQLCVRDSRLSRNGCVSDSGGVLTYVNYQSGNNFAVGLLSIAPINCDKEKPSVYTKIANYLPWIVQNMQP